MSSISRLDSLSEKSKLVAKLKDKGIPIPAKATIATLRHMDEHWLSGAGWLVRLAKPSSRKPNNPVSLLESMKTTYWLPDSDMAKRIVESKLVFVMGRVNNPPQGVKMIDVPKDYNDKWGMQSLGEEE